MESSINDQASQRIIDSDFNVKIIKIMGTKYARKILESIHEEPLSALEISKVCNIPLTKVYRWLIKLEQCSLLLASGKIGDKGRKIRLYKSKVNTITISPSEKSSPRVGILGTGNIIICSKCGSSNCIVTYDKKSNKTIGQCLNCKISYVETLSHTLKEEQQKFMILEYFSNLKSLKEEQQKMFILKKLLTQDESK